MVCVGWILAATPDTELHTMAHTLCVHEAALKTGSSSALGLFLVQTPERGRNPDDHQSWLQAGHLRPLLVQWSL